MAVQAMLNVNRFLENIPSVDEVRRAIDQRERELKALAELMRLARARDRRQVQKQETEGAGK